MRWGIKRVSASDPVFNCLVGAWLGNWSSRDRGIDWTTEDLNEAYRKRATQAYLCPGIEYRVEEYKVMIYGIKCVYPSFDSWLGSDAWKGPTPLGALPYHFMTEDINVAHDWLAKWRATHSDARCQYRVEEYKP